MAILRQGKPLASLVEKGRRTVTSRSKLKRVYVPKTIRVNRRKNAAFELHDLNLTCCDNRCLLRHGLRHIKRIIRRQRNLLYDKQYNEQNYFLSKLLEVKIMPTGKRKIGYRAPLLGEVCKTAFLKVYGISKHKIECLLKKMNFEGPLIEPNRSGQPVLKDFCLKQKTLSSTSYSPMKRRSLIIEDRVMTHMNQCEKCGWNIFVNTLMSRWQS